MDKNAPAKTSVNSLLILFVILGVLEGIAWLTTGKQLSNEEVISMAVVMTMIFVIDDQSNIGAIKAKVDAVLEDTDELKKSIERLELSIDDINCRLLASPKSPLDKVTN